VDGGTRHRAKTEAYYRRVAAVTAACLISCAVISVIAPSRSAALVAGPAAWSAPRDIGSPVAEVTRPSIQFWSDGTALLSWRVLSEHPPPQVAPDPSRRVTRLAVRAGDGAILRRATLRDGLGAPVVYGREGFAVLRQRVLGRDHDAGPRFALGVGIGTRRRLVGRTRRVASYYPIGIETDTGPTIAASHDGELAVAWAEHPPHDRAREGRYLIRVALGRVDNGFERPRTIAIDRRVPVYSPSLAYRPHGELVVAYAGRRGLEARTRRRGGSWTRAQVLGPRRRYVDIATRVSATGRIVVAWGSQNTGEGVEDSWIVRTAMLPAAARRVRPPQLLDPGQVVGFGPGSIKLGLDREGLATLAWSAWLTRDPTVPHFGIRVSRSDQYGRFQPFTQLASTSGWLGDLAVAADGTALVTWDEPWGPFLPGPSGGAAGRRIIAALRPAKSSAFGPPEAVSGLEPWSSLYEETGPTAALHPRTAAATIVWAAARAGGDPPTRLPNTATLRLATRTG
jgi:hypothetical protein